MKFNASPISDLREILSSPKKIVIVSHRNPDGDALGSSLGWKSFLTKMGHDVSFISPNTFTPNLKWIQGTEDILVYESHLGKKLCEAKINGAGLIFCLDFNAISRLESLGEIIKGSKAVKIIIDHHLEPEGFAKITFSNTSYCATAEMIYDIIKADMGETALK